jgi:phosphotransferase family enzyme
VLMYQSGLLDNLPGSLTAPRCYALMERPGDEFWIWLEDIRESTPEWTMSEHGLSARHLGEFNGAYLAGQPLPEARPWFTQGRTREWITLVEPKVEGFRESAATPLGRQWLSDDSFERTYALWKKREQLLQAFERLPVCFCHHDAFRRNLFIRQTETGSPGTVAIDWAYAGFGRVGEEIGITTANNLVWLNVAASKAKELDQTIFSSYVDGLRAAGWQGDVRLARLGCNLNAVLILGLAWPIAHITRIQDAEWRHYVETLIGFPFEDILEAAASAQLFFLDLADEAFKLIEELS